LRDASWAVWLGVSGEGVGDDVGGGALENGRGDVSCDQYGGDCDQWAVLRVFQRSSPICLEFHYPVILQSLDTCSFHPGDLDDMGQKENPI
jgi:hypothetical protein